MIKRFHADSESRVYGFLFEQAFGAIIDDNVISLSANVQSSTILVAGNPFGHGHKPATASLFLSQSSAFLAWVMNVQGPSISFFDEIVGNNFVWNKLFDAAEHLGYVYPSIFVLIDSAEHT